MAAVTGDIAAFTGHTVLEGLDFDLQCRIDLVQIQLRTAPTCKTPATVLVACRRCGTSTYLCQPHADAIAASGVQLQCDQCHCSGRPAELLTFTPIGA